MWRCDPTGPLLVPDSLGGSGDDDRRLARKLRIQYAGAVYHVMNRGDRREAIFHDDQDWRRFLVTLAEACAKTAW